MPLSGATLMCNITMPNQFNPQKIKLVPQFAQFIFLEFKKHLTQTPLFGTVG
jgi:hypothetical protein